MKSFLTSYSTCPQFLALRSIWGFWKWSQMMPYSPKYWVCDHNHVSSMPRSWVTPEFHFLKSFLTSYSTCTQILALRSIWGVWKWSQMIPYTPKHWCCHQNHVFSIFRSWVTPEVRILLLEVLLDLLQPHHSVLGLQVNLRLLKNGPKWLPIPKNLGLDPKSSV